jgi:carboxypeptidase C (cathepsin A)
MRRGKAASESCGILLAPLLTLFRRPRLAALSRSLAAMFLSLTIAGAHVALHAQDEKKAEQKDEKQTPAPPESAVVTQHEWKAAGAPVSYTATAGNLVIHDDDDKPYGSVFYVAYTKNDVADVGTRPVTFLYNGGPGAATIWLHMGSVGPMRVVTASPDATGSAPYKLVPNEYSLLGKTDLVFVDAVGTGFSKPVGKATEKDFAGTDEDVKAFERFIERYITVNKRWNSPKYLMGESYGTTRSAALADALQEKGIELNGVVLVSSILNYAVRVPGYDMEPIVYLPSYAAIAWFHNKLAQKPADLKAFLEEVRRYARGPYAEALAQGDKLPDAERDAVAQKLSSYTGLSVEYLKQTNLRISPFRFRKELLRGEREIVGRYDARFEGTDVDAAGEAPGYDPSATAITGAFVAAFHEYLSHDLNDTTADTYYVSGPKVNESWNWKHKVADRSSPLQLPYVAGDLADAMRKNPKLKVFSANGYFDLATPFFSTEYDLDHMYLEPALRSNVEFGYYPAGHMIYLNVEALKEFRDDMNRFYAETTHP